MMVAVFETLDSIWGTLQSDLGSKFTTQDFRDVVIRRDAALWEAMVDKWGPGGKGTGNYYSPANVLFNYLNSKVRQGELTLHRAIPSSPGWGARTVKLFEFVSRESAPPLDEEDAIFIEGDQKLRLHLVRERAPGIRGRLLGARAISGWSCDICDLSGTNFSDEIRAAIFEAHHSSEPLASGGQKKTSLKDMALLCANCHRLLHRLVRFHGRWFSIEDARTRLLE